MRKVKSQMNVKLGENYQHVILLKEGIRQGSKKRLFGMRGIKYVENLIEFFKYDQL